jgi:hypothetical protein
MYFLWKIAQVRHDRDKESNFFPFFFKAREKIEYEEACVLQLICTRVVTPNPINQSSLLHKHRPIG